MARVAEAYLLGGVVIASEIPLPELPPMQGYDAHLPRVDVRLGVTPPVLRESQIIDPGCYVNSSQYLLRVQGVASYLVSHGKEVVVEPDGSALDLDVRAYLLGTIYSVLCHQRGLLPLHASAVSASGGAAAFLAPSGQGKSSLAALLMRRGFSVLADDICLVDGNAMVIPSAPWLKLWRVSLDQLGWPAQGLERVFSEDDKYRLPVESALPSQPLKKLIFLEAGESGKIELEEIGGGRALASLMNLTHQAYLLEAMGKREEAFQRSGRLLSQAKAYRLTRPWGFSHMDSMVDRVEELLRG